AHLLVAAPHPFADAVLALRRDVLDLPAAAEAPRGGFDVRAHGQLALAAAEARRAGFRRTHSFGLDSQGTSVSLMHRLQTTRTQHARCSRRSMIHVATSQARMPMSTKNCGSMLERTSPELHEPGGPRGRVGDLFLLLDRPGADAAVLRRAPL